jgi:hypothetical protein
MLMRAAGDRGTIDFHQDLVTSSLYQPLSHQVGGDLDLIAKPFVEGMRL